MYFTSDTYYILCAGENIVIYPSFVIYDIDLDILLLVFDSVFDKATWVSGFKPKMDQLIFAN